jgi:ribosomal protein S30
MGIGKEANMITGTLYEAGKMMVMQNKWEQKKSTGNINKKEKKELTPQEKELQRYKEQLEETKKGNEYSALYSKIQSGQKLSLAEEDKLKAQDMKAYLDYKADQAEQEAFEEKLKHCKTKDEAQRLKTTKMQSNLSKIKNVENDPYISDAEKLRIARQIQGDTTASAKIFDKFTQSEEYDKMPTEAELQQIRKMEKDAENAAILSEAKDSSNDSEENVIENESENTITESHEETEDLILDAKSKEKEAINGDDAVLGEMQAIVSKLNKDKETGGTIDVFA